MILCNLQQKNRLKYHQLLTKYEMSRILRLEPDSQPQNLRAEPEKLERVTYRCTGDKDVYISATRT